MRRQLCWGVVALAAGVVGGCDLIRAGVKSSYTVEQAKVDEVLQAEADGGRFVAYVVTWKAQRVVVSDPLARSHHHAGDEIRFMAQTVALPGVPKTLAFNLLEP